MVKVCVIELIGMFVVFGGDEIEVLSCFEQFDLVLVNCNVVGQIVVVGWLIVLEKFVEDLLVKVWVCVLGVVGVFYIEFMVFVFDGFVVVVVNIVIVDFIVMLLFNCDGKLVIFVVVVMDILVFQFI